MTDQPEPESPEPTRGDMILTGRVLAGVDLLSHSGITDIEIAHDDDAPRWWAKGNWSGTRVYSAEGWPYPAQAVEDLLARTMNGGQCTRCGQTTIVGVVIPDYCCFLLTAVDVDDPGTYAYVRSCEAEAEIDAATPD